MEFLMIIDHQDDLGTYFRQIAPNLVHTHHVKEASWIEKSDMLDRDFAIILVEPDGTEHRKLAMHDAGNTLASITYLLTRDHFLSDSAIKLASTNLLNSAMHYGLYESFGDSLLHHEKLGSAFDVLAMLADSLSGEDIIDERRVGINKMAMYDATSYGAGNSASMGGMPQTVAVSGKPGPNGMGTGMPMPQQVNTVNTSMAAPPVKMASHITTSHDLIKEAQFMWPELDPVDRRAFALIVKEAAAEEGTYVPNEIYQYTGEKLNPSFEMLMKRRQDFTANEDLQNDYDRLSKLAYAMPLETATEALYLIDEQAGLLGRYGSNLPDPVLSVYGTEKEASWSWNHGGDYCTARDLQLLCHDPVKSKRFSDMFNEKVCEEFTANPVKAFEKRPLEQQIIIARMASFTDM